MPHHYAFTGGWLGDRLITKTDPDPRHFLDAARRIAPESATCVLQPGEPLTMTSANPVTTPANKGQRWERVSVGGPWRTRFIAS